MVLVVSAAKMGDFKGLELICPLLLYEFYSFVTADCGLRLEEKTIQIGAEKKMDEFFFKNIIKFRNI